jgi:iron complex outermembrane recepter protein
LIGANNNVRDERATSLTTGVSYASDEAPGISMALTWFSTAFEDRLQQTPYTQALLTDPYYSAIVTRNPTPAQINNACAHANYSAGSVGNCENLDPGAIIDLRLRNMATALTRGIDFSTLYRHAMHYGELQMALDGTRILQFAEKQISTAPLTSLLNTQNSPVDLRLRQSIGWRFSNFSARVSANFTNRYLDTSSIPERPVSSWTTVDLQLSYDIPKSDLSWLGALHFELDTENVFNVDPPFLNNSQVDLGYDQENANPYGRVLRLTLVKQW